MKLNPMTSPRPLLGTVMEPKLYLISTVLFRRFVQAVLHKEFAGPKSGKLLAGFRSKSWTSGKPQECRRELIHDPAKKTFS